MRLVKTLEQTFSFIEVAEFINHHSRSGSELPGAGMRYDGLILVNQVQTGQMELGFKRPFTVTNLYERPFEYPQFDAVSAQNLEYFMFFDGLYEVRGKQIANSQFAVQVKWRVFDLLAERALRYVNASPIKFGNTEFKWEQTEDEKKVIEFVRALINKEYAPEH